MQHTSYTSIPLCQVITICAAYTPADNCSVGLRSWCNTYCLQPYTALFVFVFMAATLHSSFFKGFYYNSPWSEREIWSFLRVAVSSKPERLRPPNLVYMHVTWMPTCMNFLIQFRLIKFFDDYSPWSEREIWLFWRVAVSPKPERPRPPNLVYMHATSMPTCMNFLIQFQLIKFLMIMDYSPWSEREIWPFWRVAVSPKPETPRPPNSMYMHVTSTPTCMNFLIQFQLIKYFEGNLAVFESSGISETGETTPTKLGVHTSYINAYLHEFSEPIPID